MSLNIIGFGRALLHSLALALLLFSYSSASAQSSCSECGSITFSLHASGLGTVSVGGESWTLSETNSFLEIEELKLSADANNEIEWSISYPLGQTPPEANVPLLSLACKSCGISIESSVSANYYSACYYMGMFGVTCPGWDGSYCPEVDCSYFYGVAVDEPVKSGKVKVVEDSAPKNDPGKPGPPSPKSPQGPGDPPTSVEQEVSLGRDSTGKPLGRLRWRIGFEDAAITSGSVMVERGTAGGGVIEMTFANGRRQILSGAVLIDIVPVDSNDFDKGFVLTAYHSSETSFPTNGDPVAPVSANRISQVTVEKASISLNSTTIPGIKTQTQEVGSEPQIFTLYSAPDSSGNAGEWIEERGAIAVRTVRSPVVNGVRTEVIEEQRRINGGSTFYVVSRTENTYHEFAWGEELLETTVGEGPQAKLTKYSYYTEPAKLAGKVHTTIESDGSWIRNIYDETTGELRAVYSPWLDAGGSGALTHAMIVGISANECRVDEYQLNLSYPYTSIVVSKVKGMVLSRRLTSERTLIDPATGASVVEVRTEVIRADGQRVSDNRSAYERTISGGTLQRGNTIYNLAATGERTTYSNTLVEGASPVRTSTSTTGTSSQPFGEPMKSVQSKTIAGVDGVTRQETLVAIAPGQYSTAEVTTYAYSATNGQRTVTASKDGAVARVSTVAADGVSTEVGENGIVRTFVLEPLTETSTATRQGLVITHNAVPLHNGTDLQIVTSYHPREIPSGETERPLGYVLRQERKANGVTLLDSEQEYDGGGELVASTDSVGRRTTYAYTTRTEGGRVVTETRPDGGSSISTYFRDGQLFSITGTGVVNEFHRYEPSNGNLVETVNNGSANSLRWTRTMSDGGGRQVRLEKPAQGGQAMESTSNIYNDKGQLVRVERSGGLAPVLYEYDGAGRLFRRGIDLDLDGILGVNSEDPLEETTGFYEQSGGFWWQVQRRKIYLGTGGSAGEARVIETRRRMGGGLDEVTETVDAGRKSVIATTVSRSLRKRVTTTSMPGVTTVGEYTDINGMRILSKSASDLAVTVSSYDSFERLVNLTGPAGSVTYAYDAQGRVDSESLVVGAVSWDVGYDYWPASGAGAGELYKVTAPVSQLKPDSYASTFYAYDLHGRRVKQWGVAVYPVMHEFNELGEMATMRTYRTLHGNDVEPWSPGQAAAGQISLTTWIYDQASGHLVGKKDAANQTVGYGYDGAGRLATRTWARGVTTNYQYDGAGRMTLQDYSDATPDVSYSYYRNGAVKTRVDAAGLHTFDGSSLDGSPTREMVSSVAGSSSLMAGLTFNALQDSVGRAAGHHGGIQIDGGRTLPLQGVQYQYNTQGLLHKVISGKHEVSYTRTLVSGRQVQVLTRTTTQAGLGASDSQYITDPVLGRISAIHAVNANFAATAPLQSRVRSGLRIDHKEGSSRSYWQYEVDGRGQVVDAQKHVYLTPTGSTESLMGGWDSHYAYDDIGNRVSSRFGGGGQASDPVGSEAIAYDTNAVNQYEAVENSRAAFVTGFAANSTNLSVHTNVSINGGSPTRVGNFYWQKLQPSGTGPAWEEVNFSVSRGSGSTSFQQHQYLPPVQETLSYDLDGNLTGDGRWSYTWDGENRLVGMTTQGVAEAAGVPGLKLTFAYDGLSRRVQKKVEGRTTSSDPWVLRSDTRFVYDGWNMVGEAEYLATAEDAPPTFGGGTAGPYWRRTYVWGEDLSGSLQGAGGVGGLLLINRHERGSKPLRTSWAMSDLNGNVIGLVEGELKAVYEYDPFGKPLRVSEPEEDLNPFRFSTKYTDAETGSCYYGYRYYDAVRGRWINRDPIGESGGVNLYLFVSNDGISWVDSLGLQAVSIPGPFDSMYAAAHEAGSKAVKDENDKVLKTEKERVANKGFGLRYEAKEHGGRLCCNMKGKYSYTERVDQVAKVYVFMSPQCSTLGSEWTQVGFWHSHPSEYTPLNKRLFNEPNSMSGTRGLDGIPQKGDTDVVDNKSNQNPDGLPVTMTRLLNTGNYETVIYLGNGKYEFYQPQSSGNSQNAKIK